jgi:hypothetical protein
MKEALQTIAALALLAFLFGPLVALIFDAGCWFFAAHQCTSIPWEADKYLRPWLVLLWTVLAPLGLFS